MRDKNFINKLLNFILILVLLITSLIHEFIPIVRAENTGTKITPEWVKQVLLKDGAFKMVK